MVSANRISTVHGIDNADDEMANVITAYAQKVVIGVSWIILKWAKSKIH